MPAVTIGASFGGAYLAANALQPVSIRKWNPIVSVTKPREDAAKKYLAVYELYRELYEATASITHALVRLGSTA